MDSQTRWAAYQEVLRTDAAGKVALGRYSPKDTLKVRAAPRAPRPSPTVVALRGLRQPIRLELSEKAGVALRGTLVDDAGNPIPQAKISLMAEMDAGRDMEHEREVQWYGSRPIRLEQCQSDAKGSFALGGLWPDAKYVVLVKVPGHERYASAQIEAAGGKARDLGKIVLPRTTEAVAGRILDSAGKPVADARVFNSGDGPEPMETRSDAAGQFRLARFPQGAGLRLRRQARLPLRRTADRRRDNRRWN